MSYSESSMAEQMNNQVSLSFLIQAHSLHFLSFFFHSWCCSMMLLLGVCEKKERKREDKFNAHSQSPFVSNLLYTNKQINRNRNPPTNPSFSLTHVAHSLSLSLTHTHTQSLALNLCIGHKTRFSLTLLKHDNCFIFLFLFSFSIYFSFFISFFLSL